MCIRFLFVQRFVTRGGRKRTTEGERGSNGGRVRGGDKAFCFVCKWFVCEAGSDLSMCRNKVLRNKYREKKVKWGRRSSKMFCSWNWGTHRKWTLNMKSLTFRFEKQRKMIQNSSSDDVFFWKYVWELFWKFFTEKLHYN